MGSCEPLCEMNIEITQRCMQNCKHCSSSATTHATNQLSYDEVQALVSEFKQLGGCEIEISGGEPLLHPRIFDILRFVKKEGLQLSLFTCGNFQESMNESEISVSNKLAQIGLEKVVCSLHGSNNNTHDDIADTKESFFQTVLLIKKLVEAGLKVGVHSVPMSPNFEELEDLVDFVSELGVYSLRILRFVPQGRGKENKEHLMMNPEEMASLIEQLTDLKRRTDINVEIGSHLDFTFLLDDSNPSACKAGRTKCLIEPSGNVLPCAVFKGRKEFVAGSIKTRSLSQIWCESPVFNLFREFSPSELRGMCSECSFLEICHGRCPGQRVYDHDDFYEGPDEYCPRNIFTND